MVAMPRQSAAPRPSRRAANAGRGRRRAPQWWSRTAVYRYLTSPRRVDINLMRLKQEVVDGDGLVHLRVAAISARSVGAGRRWNGRHRTRCSVASHPVLRGYVLDDQGAL